MLPAAQGQPASGGQDGEAQEAVDSEAEDLAGDAEGVEPQPLPVSWLETQAVMEGLAESGDFEAALALSDHLLDLAAEQFGEDSRGVAEAHLLIANLRRQNDQFNMAEIEILRAIEIYEDITGPLSPELIDPYLKLGDNYGEGGDYTGALAAYGEARNIGRRHYGLLNEDQIAIIDDMSEAAEELGQVEEAAQLQLEALVIVERNHTEASVEAIDAKYRYATWLREHGRHEDALHMYYQIESVIKDHFDSDPLMTVRLLRERSRSLQVPAGDAAAGMPRSSLADALEILEGMPDPPPLIMAEVLVEMGDWQVKYARSRVPSSYYIRAWTLLGQVENGDELRRQWFDELVAIELPRISQRGLTDDPDAPAGHVIVYFTVDTSGHTQNIEITDSEPPGLKDSPFPLRATLCGRRRRIGT
jgi:tetratricopeptide (TPR) repeat protein